MADRSAFGPVPPYGAPIRQALASGDTTRMREVRENARKWLDQNPGHQKQGEVHAALRELEERLGSTR
jgi:hypothetical protein